MSYLMPHFYHYRLAIRPSSGLVLVPSQPEPGVLGRVSVLVVGVEHCVVLVVWDSVRQTWSLLVLAVALSRIHGASRASGIDCRRWQDREPKTARPDRCALPGSSAQVRGGIDFGLVSLVDMELQSCILLVICC